MKTVAIVQARMGSTRLPGKIMLDLGGEPVLTRVVNRASRSCRLDEIVIATTDLPADDQVVELCRSRGWSCFRGSQDDVLDRYYRAALDCKAELIVRITSDCPLIDPSIIDLVIDRWHASAETDYASNTIQPRTFPRGLDVEAFSFSALERAWQRDANPGWREHVTPYIYRHPEEFGIEVVTNDIDYSAIRWTLDVPEDLDLIRMIYHHFGNDLFSWEDAVSRVAADSTLRGVNSHVLQKEI
ncbi:MAG TPA: glycosyltransferase family protein [Blastocatellia bacterium]|nr:glycosyltransferase family protein [Blastocatellia bacterium]